MKALINVNGLITSPEEAKISVFDRGFLYGDSVYEVTQTYHAKPFMMKEHMERLFRSASRIGLDIGKSSEDIEAQVQKTVDALGEETAYIRIIVTRGEGEIGLDPELAPGPNMIIIVKKLLPYPKEWYEKGVHMIIAGIKRNPRNSIDPNIKSGNYLNNVLAMKEAKERGALDAIMLNHEGFVTEGTTSNIWMIKNGELITPPIQAGLLGGITRQTLLKLCKESSLQVKEQNFTDEELKGADEAFLTSTTKKIVPITQIDDELIGSGRPGSLTQKVMNIYQEFIDTYYK